MNGSLKRIWGWISMLKVQELQVNYGGIRAVKNISFEVPDGSIVTLVGANGAGKSTTLRTIAGQVKAQAGSITYNGEELLGRPSDEIVKRGITLVPEGRRVFTDMTVLENMKIGAYLRRDKPDQDIEWCFTLFPRLKERHWQLAGTLSGGEQQMLAVARALMSRPWGLPPLSCGISSRSSGRSISRALPFCLSSRTPTWRSIQPTWPTFSKPVRLP